MKEEKALERSIYLHDKGNARPLWGHSESDIKGVEKKKRGKNSKGERAADLVGANDAQRLAHKEAQTSR